MGTLELLKKAVAHVERIKNAPLGEALQGHGTIDIKDMESIIQMLHDEIADQYYEDAPNSEVQSFLNSILTIKKNYHRYY